MPTVSEIVLVPSRPQKLSVALGGITYGMFFQWRDFEAQCWIMDLLDENNVMLVAGVPLLPGTDILAQYPEIGFVGQLWVESDGNPTGAPDFAGLGVTTHLYYVTYP